MNIIIGVDNGNKLTKTLNNNFISGVTSTELQPALNVDWLKFENMYYVLSNDRNLYLRDKTVDERTFVLTLFAVAKEILSRDLYSSFLEIDLAVGLPPEHLSTLASKFKNYFLKKEMVSFFYKDKLFRLHFKSVNCFPQTFAAIAKDMSEIAEYSTVYVVDIGGYTMDVLEINDGNLNFEKCQSKEFGVIKMYNKVIKAMRAVNIIISEKEIDDIILGNVEKILLPVEYQVEIKKIVDDYINAAFSTLREDDCDIKNRYTFFIGGGSKLFAEYIKNNKLVGKHKINYSISANAEGYEYLTKMILKE